MLEYKKAPYIELDNYKIPAGGTFIYIPMQDNKNIRLAYWQLPKTNKECRGTVLLQQGHNEFIEKYYETIQDLIDRNFNVISFDWRGQGMSDRMINNKNKQYVEDFSIHCQDLTFIINEIIYNKLCILQIKKVIFIYLNQIWEKKHLLNKTTLQVITKDTKELKN